MRKFQPSIFWTAFAFRELSPGPISENPQVAEMSSFSLVPRYFFPQQFDKKLWRDEQWSNLFQSSGICHASLSSL